MTSSATRRAPVFLTILLLAAQTLPAFAGAPTYDTKPVTPEVRCMGVHQIIQFYRRSKQADAVTVKKTEYDNIYAVSVKKNGKTGKYEFNSCARTSTKIS
jgi:hypothetical protein